MVSSKLMGMQDLGADQHALCLGKALTKTDGSEEVLAGGFEVAADGLCCNRRLQGDAPMIMPHVLKSCLQFPKHRQCQVILG